MADERIPSAAADGFQQGADAYERSRPSYPAEAVACIVGHAGLGPGRRVLDLAAGTGKLTRLLVPSGADVVAVEPVAAMRTALRSALPDLEILDGTAAAIPIGDGSVDAVTVAQAFHWFDVPAALAELHRVLRSGGTLVLTWNTRDRSVDWVRAFGDVLDTGGERPYDSYYQVDYPALVAEQGRGGFTTVEEWSCDWEQPFTPELLVARAASVSVVAALPEEERAEVLERVRELVATHPELAGRPAFGFPYTTRVFWCRRV
jgi:SAM-dependent methyltransferase